MYTQTRNGLEQELTSPNAFQPSYERFAGDLPIDFGQIEGLGKVNERRAARLNRRAARWLGWLTHRDRIIQLLKLPTTVDENSLARKIRGQSLNSE